MLKQDRRYVVATSRAVLADAGDTTNGIVARLEGWRTLLPNLDVVDLFAKTPDIGPSDQLIVDLTGEKLSTCVAAWKRWRRYGPACFLQDSQIRYHGTGFLGGAGLKRRLKFLVDTARGLIRELFCHGAFRSVGYVSPRDRLFGVFGHDVRWMQASTVLSAGRGAFAAEPLRYLRMIGNFGYMPNEDGALRILHDPSIGAVMRRYGLKLILSGVRGIELGKLLPADLVELELSGPFKHLADLQRPDQLLICPSLYGSGIKNKILEGQIVGSFSLVWHAFSKEFPYPPDWTDYFHSMQDLAGRIGFTCARLSSASGPIPYFRLMEEYRMHRFLASAE